MTGLKPSNLLKVFLSVRRIFRNIQDEPRREFQLSEFDGHLSPRRYNPSGWILPVAVDDMVIMVTCVGNSRAESRNILDNDMPGFIEAEEEVLSTNAFCSSAILDIGAIAATYHKFR